MFLIYLPVLIAQWIGVVNLAKTGRRGEWWSMLIGTILITLGPILQMFILTFIKFGSGDPMSTVETWMLIGGISTLGSLLFAAGFGVHGYRSSRRHDRITELEMMNLAQATELERLRNR